jgi:murein L,D-transpeptidase YafK
MIRLFLLTAFVALSACNASLPSSALLNLVRGERQSQLATEMRQHEFKLGQPVLLRVFKQEGILEAWLGDEETGRYALYKTYPICKFSGSLGPKLKEGDKQAPEGFYLVGARQLNPNSSFHLAMNIGYPNAFDRAHGRTGSALMIHGGCESTGCFAMTNPAIEEVYLLVDNAMRNSQKYVNIHIFPFRMSPENMAMHANNQWHGFWTNIKTGYDAFEATKIPPLIGVEDHRYVFYDRMLMAAAASAQTGESTGESATSF